MEDKLKKIGRLALRREGDWWNAYYAMPNTMDGAVLLGTIAMAAVVGNDKNKQAFMALMQDVMADFIKEKYGVRPSWREPPHGAPENERAGHS